MRLRADDFQMPPHRQAVSLGATMCWLWFFTPTQPLALLSRAQFESRSLLYKDNNLSD